MSTHRTVRFTLTTSTPRALNVSVEPTLYCVAGGEITRLEPSRSEPFSEEHSLLFDSRYGDTLGITFVDLISGNYTATLLTYDVPETCSKLLEVLRTKGLEHGLYAAVYECESDSRVLFTPIVAKKLSKLSEALGVKRNLLKTIIPCKIP